MDLMISFIVGLIAGMPLTLFIITMIAFHNHNERYDDAE